VDYVLIHELCHTRVRNHSPRFWALVSRYCPDHARLRAELRTAGRNLPTWAGEWREGER
jgi:predicted metal-dependent hydrolase